MSLRALRGTASNIDSYTPQVLFDVGANVGQTSTAFAKEFPKARIHAFEPISSSFEALRSAVPSSVSCHKFALGARAETGLMLAQEKSVTNRLIADDLKVNKPTETITISTGDLFCAEQGIEHIDYLKIDTEGNDLNVLIGFGKMLAAQQIDYLQVEAAMNPLNSRHVDHKAFHGFLEPFGYSLTGIYDMVKEKHRVAMRRSNLVFVSAKANRR